MRAKASSILPLNIDEMASMTAAFWDAYAGDFMHEQFARESSCLLITSFESGIISSMSLSRPVALQDTGLYVGDT